MIALGSDHGGLELKNKIIKYLEEHNIAYKDFGCYENKSCDYPVFWFAHRESAFPLLQTKSKEYAVRCAVNRFPQK